MSVADKKPVEVARRSRRAASLTAQCLWNIQIEDDTKATKKSTRKASSSDELMYGECSSGHNKKCFKRTISETAGSRQPGTSTCKKQKLPSNGCSGGCAFQPSKPIAPLGKSKVHSKKLTASVAPLIKPRQIQPKVMKPHDNVAVQHANSILLLPVSLQTNQGSTASGEVGNLSLVTLQASPDLMSCFGLGKTSRQDSRNIWHPPVANDSRRGSTGASRNMKIDLRPNNLLFHKLSSVNVNVDRPTSTFQAAGQQGQDEPLNLKMGETKVPSTTKHLLPARMARHGQGIRPLMTCTVSVPRPAKPGITSAAVGKVRGNVRPVGSVGRDASILLRQTHKGFGNRAVYAVVSKPNVHGQRTNKGADCPSPEYACSSPDVDDVHRDVRHSCNRQHINLRNKAVPPHDSNEYKGFEAEQRRALDAAQRRQKAKIAKMKLTRSDSDENRPLLDPLLVADQPQTFNVTEDSNNGWKWAGKPYFGMVYSVESGKYVRRRCYPAMTRYDDDGQVAAVVMVRDCVFLCAGGEDEAPYVAKVTGLWEKPHGGDMTMSLLWYYRPEHTEDPRMMPGATSPSPACDEDELFVSRHQDEISVACVEDRCHVLTYSQYCRVQARLSSDHRWRSSELRRVVPALPAAARKRPRPSLPGESQVDESNLFFSRKLYDVKGKRVLKYLTVPSSLVPEHTKRGTTAG